MRDKATLLEVLEVLSKVEARTKAAYEHDRSDYAHGCYKNTKHVISLLDTFIKYTNDTQELHND